MAFVIPALVWLTVKSIQMDDAAKLSRRSTEIQKREAEVQETVSNALWRMDWLLTPLIGQEATRPFYDYQPFYTAFSKTSRSKVKQSIPSPILIQPSEFVLLHFQIDKKGNWTSPQNPTSTAMCSAAMDNGLTAEAISCNLTRLNTLSSTISAETLEDSVPTQLIPNVQVPEIAMNNPWTINSNSGIYNRQVAQNLPAIEQSEIPFFRDQRQARSRDSDNAYNPGEIFESGNSLPSQSASRQQTGQKMLQNTYANDVENGFRSRREASRNFAQQQRINSLANQDDLEITMGNEGVSRPVWINGKLLLVRRVAVSDQTFLQGCWFDWDRIREVLKEEVEDILPQVKLTATLPDEKVSPGRLLATLPVKLELPDEQSLIMDGLEESKTSPIRWSLLMAWSCLLDTAFAVGLLLQGVVKLSERRASFVSAVTHELRTPLTTFRMYAEMLAGNMVSSEQKRQEYAETLHVEANRLSHLVENVLQFARLEGGNSSTQNETVQVGNMIDRFESRIRERAEQAEMELKVDLPEDVSERLVQTNPTGIEHILYNLVDNSCKYACRASNREIKISVGIEDSKLCFRVHDHGPGIAKDQRKRIFLPFSKSAEDAAKFAPGVGLGLALCRRLSRQLGGALDLENRPSDQCGTCLKLSVPIN